MDTTYTTRQGELILSLLKNQAGKHFTAEEIMNSLSQAGHPVGKATIYRHLDKLIKIGQVRKYIVDEGSSACYEYLSSTQDCHRHYHLKCSVCGKLIHMECEYLDEVASHVLSHHGFVVSPEKTVLYGICRQCRGTDDEK
ncbi:MAG: transcriptional repressor [Ruminococcus sp.]|nr:transcriptional repressor [Candidatus Copronaster equi]